MAAASLSALTRARSRSPSWLSNTNVILASTSSALTNPCCHPTTSTPTPNSSTINTLFIFCSAYKGQQSIGTPAMIASCTEFHPQCCVEVWVTVSTERDRAAMGRGSHHPEEPVARSLEPNGDLLDLVLRMAPYASETEEHDTVLWLLVEPCEARVIVLLFCLTTGSLNKWPYSIHRRQRELVPGKEL
nr:unnamed protein product [Digitaria exilis]